VLCVTGSPQVEAIVHGPDGLASAGKPLLVIDCSTSEPASTRRMAAELAPKTFNSVARLINSELGGGTPCQWT
jgi:3-hydroxyisobutyrate dehydrogenase-like beta-hydroxyacid dehydrogenase